MAVEEHLLYVRWTQAELLERQRKQFYEVVKNKRGENDVLTKDAKAKWEEARREYEAVVSQL